jgi:hypothetical protein
MATQVVGTGRFQYSSGPVITVNCGSKLFDITFRSARTRYVSESDDLTVREIITIGDPIKEIIATVGFHDDPDEAQDMIDFGLDGGVLTYSPDGGSTSYACLLIDASEVTPFERRVGFGEYQFRLTLRATGSTTDFAALASLP